MSDTDTIDPADEQPGRMFPASYVHELRQEAATSRVRAKDAEAKAEAKAEARYAAKFRELQIAQAITDVAAKLGASPKLVRGSLLIDGLTDSLQPGQPDFADAVTSLVETAIENDPDLKASVFKYPVRSGAPTEGNAHAPGVVRQGVDREMLRAAHAANDHDQIMRWKNDGELDAILRGQA